MLTTLFSLILLKEEDDIIFFFFDEYDEIIIIGNDNKGITELKVFLQISCGTKDLRNTLLLGY